MEKVSLTNITSYWYKTVPNFGDFITPELIKYYGGNPIFARPEHAAFISTGSILELVPENYTGCILGSGFIKSDTAKSFPAAKVIGVRGKLTSEKLNLNNVCIGDPGLLVANLYSRMDKLYTLGIIPHYVDNKDMRILKILKNNKDILLIDVQQSPEKVLQEIDKCEHIISSSLHGIIAADALGIRCRWMLLSNKVIGNGFKFKDYYSIYDVVPTPYIITGEETTLELINTTIPSPNGIDDIKYRLDKAFTTTINTLL